MRAGTDQIQEQALFSSSRQYIDNTASTTSYSFLRARRYSFYHFLEYSFYSSLHHLADTASATTTFSFPTTLQPSLQPSPNTASTASHNTAFTASYRLADTASAATTPSLPYVIQPSHNAFSFPTTFSLPRTLSLTTTFCLPITYINSQRQLLHPRTFCLPTTSRSTSRSRHSFYDYQTRSHSLPSPSTVSSQITAQLRATYANFCDY